MVELGDHCPPGPRNAVLGCCAPLAPVQKRHTKAPYKSDLLWRRPRALNRPGRARTGARERPLLRELVAGAAGVVVAALVEEVAHVEALAQPEERNRR
jgi:hypothetical protein